MKHLREYLLVAAYVILVAIVAFGGYWIDHEFELAHDDQCQVAHAQVEVAAVQLSATLRGQDAPPNGSIRIVNDAVRRLNDACDLDLPPVTPERS